MKQNVALPQKTIPQKLSGALRIIENGLVIVSACIFLLLMFIGVGDVIGRKLGHPITGAYEISTILMGAIVLLGWAYTQKEGGHVSVELFYNKFPPRLKQISSLVGWILTLALFATITAKSWSIALKYTLEGRTLQILDIPSGPFYFLVPIGGFFMCLEIIITLIQFFERREKG